MITSKNQIIEHFESGIRKTRNFKIGVKHEKFLFNNITVTYQHMTLPTKHEVYKQVA